MVTWSELERRQPALASAGRGQFYQFGIGLGFLATVRPGGGPRVHPVCPVISPAGLHVHIKAGPKQRDLRSDGCYALHSETCPPPRQDDGFAITGRAREVTDAAVIGVVRGQILTERSGQVWPGFDQEARLRADHRAVPAGADPAGCGLPGWTYHLESRKHAALRYGYLAVVRTAR
jgi:hypothetical protein